MFRLLCLILVVMMSSNVQSQFRDCQGNSCSLLPRLGVVHSVAPVLSLPRTEEPVPFIFAPCEETRIVLLRSDCEEVSMEIQRAYSFENGMRYSDSNVGYRSRMDNQALRSNRPVLTLLTRIRTKTRNAFSTVFGKARQSLRFGSCR